MSQYGIEYRIQFVQANVWDGTSKTDIQGRTIRISIFQTSVLIGDTDTPEVIALKGTGNPFTIDVIDNDRNKLTPIRAKQATIRFKSDANQLQVIETFCDRPDNEWLVHIKDVWDDQFIFIGFLMLADLEQLMQPDPKEVVLIASDHLGILKDKPLVDADGLNPIGKYKIAELVAMCLKQTGLDLDIRVVNNIRAGGGQLINTLASTIFNASSGWFTLPSAYQDFFYVGQRITISGTASNNGTFTVLAVGVLVVTFVSVAESLVNETVATAITFDDNHSNGHLWDKIYLDAKTFEQEINESENCYTVLSKIAGFDGFFTQWQGKWWYMRVDEFDANSIYIGHFDSAGLFVTMEASGGYTKNIGRLKPVKFAGADNTMLPDRAYRLVKLTLNYNQFSEAICNIDFSRGAVVSSSNPLDIIYSLECWTLREGVPGHYGTVDGTTARIHKIYNNLAYEIERYLTLTPRTTFESSSINDATYVESQGVSVIAGDKFTASIDFRLTSTPGGIATVRLFRFVLNGSDGSWWILDCDTDGQNPIWHDTVGWTVFSGDGARDIDFSISDWQSHSIESPIYPVSGTLYCWINQLNQNTASYDNQDVQFSNLQFTHLWAINATFQRFSGHYNQVTRATDPTLYNAKLDEEVFIGDAPRPEMKGALFFLAGGNYYLAPIFYSSAQFALGTPPDTSYLHPYGWHQIQAVWNQHRNHTRFFSGTVRGLGQLWADLLYKVTLTDVNPNYQNRYFMVISFSQDWRHQMASMVFGEVYRIDTGRVYTDTFVFVFISSVT